MKKSYSRLDYKYNMDLNTLVGQMRTMGDMLIPYSFPYCEIHEEQEISILKSREICIDGYNVEVSFNKSYYPHPDGSFFLEVVHIAAKYSTFLPFNIVVKIGKKFLEKKTYHW